MTVAVTRKELGAGELRREAGRCRDARAARRMLALALVLRISTQAAGSGCVAITGMIADVAAGGQTNNIEGFYCPLSGRVSFLRKNVQTNDTESG